MTTLAPFDHDKLAAAKLWLTATPDQSRVVVGDAPYLSTAVYALITVPCEEVSDVAADERWRLYVNPGWLETASVSDVASGMAHVVIHLLIDHADRARSMQVGHQEAKAWGAAADSSVGDILDDMGLPGAQPLRRAASREFSRERATEERYATINRLTVPTSDEPEHHRVEEIDTCIGCGSSADGLPHAHERAAAADGALDLHAADKIRETVAIAYKGYRADRTPGTRPADWLRFSEKALDPVVPWQQVLAAAIRRAVGWSTGLVDYTYSRPSRRQSAVSRVVLPGMRRPCPDIAIVVDTSGSIDDGLLAQALAEIEGTLAAVGTADTSVHVLAADAAVHSVQRVRRGSPVKLIGGGGTDMRVGIEEAAALRPRRPDVTIVLTDGDTPWPSAPPPGMVVVAALLGRHRAELPTTPLWVVRVECVAA